MKPCSYCGRENAEQALTCSECGAAFNHGGALGPGPSVGDWFKQPISPNLKAHSLSAAWGGVVLVTLAIKPAYLLTAPAFPLGLLALNVAGCKKLNETAAAIHSRVG